MARKLAFYGFGLISEVFKIYQKRNYRYVERLLEYQVL